MNRPLLNTLTMLYRVRLPGSRQLNNLVRIARALHTAVECSVWGGVGGGGGAGGAVVGTCPQVPLDPPMG